MLSSFNSSKFSFFDSAKQIGMKDKVTQNVAGKAPACLTNASESRKRQHERPSTTCSACILCGYNRTDVSYHRFPLDPTRNDWLKLCELPETTKTANLRICGRHFSDDQKWTNKFGSTLLLHGVVPKLNLEVYGLNGDDHESTPPTVSHASTSRNSVNKMSSTSSSSSTPCENDSYLTNNSNIELVEVVEMKIYRFNPSSASESPQSPDLVSPADSVPSTSSKDQSDFAALVRGLHSYSKPAPDNVSLTNSVDPNCVPKRVKALRYFGDFTEEDYATPNGAKICWSIAKRLIDKRNEKILQCQEENEILERRLKNLKEIILSLRRTGSIPSKYRKRLKQADSSSNSAAESRISDQDASPN